MYNVQIRKRFSQGKILLINITECKVLTDVTSFNITAVEQKETDMQSCYLRTAEFCELVEINAKCQNRRRTMLMSVRQIGQPLPIRFR